MIQVALGGYRELNAVGTAYSISTFYDQPIFYLEPDYNILFPLEFNLLQSDDVFILFRERTNIEGTSFSDDPSLQQSLSPYSITVKDATTGTDIFATQSNVLYNEYWIDTDDIYGNHIPFGVIEIHPKIAAVSSTQSVETLGSRIIDVNIISHANNDFINFRINLTDHGQNFHYIYIDNEKYAFRSTTSNSGVTTYINVSSGTSYLLLSPVEPFEETSVHSIADFSYPLNSVYYTRQHLINNENYSYSLTAYSNVNLLKYVHITPIPRFSKVGVVGIDNGISSIVTANIEYIDISAVGQSSGSVDTFRIYIAPKLNPIIYSLEQS